MTSVRTIARRINRQINNTSPDDWIYFDRDGFLISYGDEKKEGPGIFYVFRGIFPECATLTETMEKVRAYGQNKEN